MCLRARFGGLFFWAYARYRVAIMRVPFLRLAGPPGLLLGSLLLSGGCTPRESPPAAAPAPAATALANPEAPIPAQCYTRTEGRANPCWTCHTSRNGRNLKGDWGLQEQYAFSEAGLVNHWTNLHADRRAEAARIGDAEIRAWVGQDNYSALRRQPAGAGWQPDLDYAAGFDAQGFARDGSGWRAFRYKPFPGTFWPTNGAIDDVLIRLPPAFRQDARGRPSSRIYRINLAILEAAMTVADTVPDAQLQRRVEPVDEHLAGRDLDGDGRLAPSTRVRGLPTHYAGGAAAVPVQRWLYPAGTEFLHSVRYLDPDSPGRLPARLKELRYSVKRHGLDDSGLERIYGEAAQEKLVGRLPWFPGDAGTGLRNTLGWEYQGWIEAADGRLRRQTLEEHYFCMGCHGGIGITQDSSFGFPRKVPGADGWGWQRLDGLPDVPQAGHSQGEYRTYLERVGGGDEFRANAEVSARFLPGGVPDPAAFAALEGDIRTLVLPSRERALALNKAYLALVRSQSFALGRDTLLAPAEKVLDRVSNGDTGLRQEGRVYSDGRIWLDWPEPIRGTGLAP